MKKSCVLGGAYGQQNGIISSRSFLLSLGDERSVCTFCPHSWAARRILHLLAFVFVLEFFFQFHNEMYWMGYLDG